MRLGEFLIQSGAVQSSDVEIALATQRFRPRRIGRLLKELGLLSGEGLDREVSKFLDTRARTPEVSELGELKSRIEAAALDSRVLEFSRKRGVLLYREQGKLQILSRSFHDAILEEAEDTFGEPCEIRIVEEAIFRVLGAVLGAEEEQTSQLRIEEPVSDEKRIAALDPYTSFFRTMVVQAKDLRASDIHIEPVREGVDLRVRVDGDLISWRSLQLEHRRPFINELKRLLNLDIALSGAGQDSRVSLRQWGLDLRVSLAPIQYGEKIVLRLLDLNRKFELSASGFDAETVQALSDTLKLSHGVVLISGPTGSGKTTTLYSLLSAMDRKALNIMTLEDPIEYSIDGLIQVPITKKFGFSEALRTALRQDPDVILVGEIRDAETADLCVKAASTGHLVLSTLHANGAAEVVERLLGLGVEKQLLRSVLKFSSAQRLIQKLCPHCWLTYDPGRAPESMKAFPLRTKNPEGCEHCKKGVPGILGRVPVLEYMKEAEIAAHLVSPHPVKYETSLRRATERWAEKGEVDYETALATA